MHGGHLSLNLPPFGFLIQTYAFYGTDVDIVIQTAIQTHAFYDTDVQTVDN